MLFKPKRDRPQDILAVVVAVATTLQAIEDTGFIIANHPEPTKQIDTWKTEGTHYYPSCTFARDVIYRNADNTFSTNTSVCSEEWIPVVSNMQQQPDFTRY
jgi:hypothetical protein